MVDAGEEGGIVGGGVGRVQGQAAHVVVSELRKGWQSFLRKGPVTLPWQMSGDGRYLLLELGVVFQLLAVLQ